MNEQEHKHRCAVRLLCKWRTEWGLAKFREYLSKYKLDSKLLTDFAEQWKLGNKGNQGEWIE